MIQQFGTAEHPQNRGRLAYRARAPFGSVDKLTDRSAMKIAITGKHTDFVEF